MRVSELFNTLLFTQQQQQEEQEVRVSQLFNTLVKESEETRKMVFMWWKWLLQYLSPY